VNDEGEIECHEGADLHVHTTASDGTLTLDEVPAAAQTGGVDLVAITDHDRVHPGLSAPVTQVDGVTILRGIELRVDARGQRIDLLGYGVKKTQALENLIEEIQQNRIERGRRMISAVESELNTALDVTIEEGFGRPAVARAIDESTAPYDYSQAFEDLIGHGCPCYLKREVPSFADAISILRSSCAFVGLAHPFRYPDVDAAIQCATKLDAIERYYNYRPQNASKNDPGRIETVADANNLSMLGGSDAHSRTLGVAGPPLSAITDLTRAVSTFTDQ
jgi:predicted metal-dependent phosphoesterase TrpH